MEQKQKLGQDPAFANRGQIHEPSQLGMSKRFYAACAAMQGLIANPNIMRPNPTSGMLDDQYKSFIKIAYEYADELLKQENE